MLNNVFDEKSDVLLEENVAYFLQLAHKYMPDGESKDHCIAAIFNKIHSVLEESEIKMGENRKVILREKIIASANMRNQ